MVRLPLNRCLLFVPAHDQRKLEKALTLDVDGLILDLEDAVPPAGKAAARETARAFLTRNKGRFFVRLNAVVTPYFLDDVLLLTGVPLAGVVLAKTESAGEVDHVDWLLGLLEQKNDLTIGAIEIMPFIESARALENAREIAAASPRVRRLLFGGNDYAADIGTGIGGPAFFYARSRLVAVSRACGLEPPVDTVNPDFKNPAALAADARTARRLGFQGKMAVHPAQVDVIRAVFTPTAAEIREAENIVAAFEAAGGAVTKLDGRMVEWPHVVKARRILATVAGPQQADQRKEAFTTMRKPLWEPSPEVREKANLTRFMALINQKYGLDLSSYQQLYAWSVRDIPAFWAAMWEFAGIKATCAYDRVVDDLERFPGARWFPGASLNFAENLLRCRDDRPAVIFQGETEKTTRLTYAELYARVAGLVRGLRDAGVREGDRVCAYLPNLPETCIAMLATASIGALWASCATDIGPRAATDRLGQVEPKVLFACDGYFYKGKAFDSLAAAREVARNIPSLEKVIVVPYIGENPDLSGLPGAVRFDDFPAFTGDITFNHLPFSHPLYIMFSSGTTGKPKCMVQGAGGVLINHLKELLLHADLKPADTIIYITTCSWMMWNWLMSSLAAGSTMVLYDGNPAYPGPQALWHLIEREKISIFGTSASYINFLRTEGLRPGTDHDLSCLREILQTGSALSAEGFEYVYREIKEDLHFNSISGGTDINGCFAGGNIISPVYAGELQGPCLGMKVKAYDEQGRSIVDQQGELVCEAPAPSMPLYFWRDPENKKYLDTYFQDYPGVWRHGDYILVHGDTGGITFFGRSDAVLKPSGVRIGTAEIYDQVERLPEVADSLAIGQNWHGDQRVILFVRLREGFSLTKELEDKIKRTLRENASPRHVPALVLAVPDIPYTFNGKKVESAVTNIVNGRPVVNRDALGNPASLDYFAGLLPLLQKE